MSSSSIRFTLPRRRRQWGRRFGSWPTWTSLSMAGSDQGGVVNSHYHSYHCHHLQLSSSSFYIQVSSSSFYIMLWMVSEHHQKLVIHYIYWSLQILPTTMRKQVIFAVIDLSSKVQITDKDCSLGYKIIKYNQ